VHFAIGFYMKKYRKIWEAKHRAKCEGFTCDECGGEVYTNDLYARRVVEYATERGNKSLLVMREHLSPGCGKYS
jgi:hypothetical protein